MAHRLHRIRSSHHRPRSQLAGQTSASVLLKVGLLVVSMFLIWWLAFSSPPTASDDAASAAGSVAPASSPPAPQVPMRVEQKPTPAAEPAVPTAEPAAATTPAPSAKATALTANTVSVIPPQRQGPVDELAQRFASESRGPDSEKEEARVREAFSDPAIAPGLLHSVECRRSACRAELHWRSEHDMGYVLGLTRAVGTYSAPVGIEPAGAPEPDGHRPVIVYFGLSSTRYK